MPRKRTLIAIVAGGALVAMGMVVPGSPAAAGGALVSFACEGEPETWTVPSGVSEILVEAWGAQGGQGRDGIWTPEGPNFQLLQGNGGLGGHTKTALDVTPGDELTITVGCRGGDGSMSLGPDEATSSGGAGGFNGGGPGGSALSGFNSGEEYAVASASGGGGGGTRVMLGSTEIWAGGGGGGAGGTIQFIPGSDSSGGAFGGAGGYGGGTAGETGLAGAAGSAPPTGGGGGTDISPGAGGTTGGGAGLGSQGGTGASSGCVFAVQASGGVGGGWQAGGSGGVVPDAAVGACESYVASGGPAGGGGGSGIAPFGVFEGGVREGEGLVVITWDVNGNQPDAQVKLGSEWVGDDEYYPPGQGIQRDGKRRVTQTYEFRVENDGPESDTFVLAGTGSAQTFDIKYFVGGVDRTARFVAGTFQRSLNPGQVVNVKVTVRPKGSALIGAKIPAYVFATSDDLTDRARATTVVVP